MESVCLMLANASAMLRVNSVLELYSGGLGLEAYDGSLTVDGHRSKLGKVRSVRGSAVIVAGVPEHLRSGVYDIRLTWQSRLHPATTMDVTAGKVVGAGVDPAALASWRVYDYIQGARLAPGTYITAIDDHGGAMTLSQPALATATGMRLYDADIQKLAAGTPV